MQGRGAAQPRGTIDQDMMRLSGIYRQEKREERKGRGKGEEEGWEFG